MLTSQAVTAASSTYDPRTPTSARCLLLPASVRQSSAGDDDGPTRVFGKGGKVGRITGEHDRILACCCKGNNHRVGGGHTS